MRMTAAWLQPTRGLRWLDGLCLCERGFWQALPLCCAGAALLLAHLGRLGLDAGAHCHARAVDPWGRALMHMAWMLVRIAMHVGMPVDAGAHCHGALVMHAHMHARARAHGCMHA